MPTRVLVAVLSAALTAAAQTPADYAGLRWRNIGPFRAGRTVGAEGVPSQPNVFYVGVNNGGVWRTTDYGVTWKPIFDSQPTGSIGTLAVAPSNPNIIYVGSGEGLQRPDLSVGDGIYKTTDGGKSWEHLGLRDGQQIASILIDPRNANRLWVAVLGHPYGPNPERGIFKSTDGGHTFRKVLYKDQDTGGMDLAMDPKNPGILYAVLWQARQGPWENAAWQGPGSGLFKSTDGGETWRPLTRGLPTFAEGLGRIGITVAPSDGNRVYAIVDARAGGIYRSDDAGESFQRVCADSRVWSRGSDFAWIRVDPRNKDILYSANLALYKSTDGGATFRSIKGAPGGDDYHSLWINPGNPNIMLSGVDQGATLTVNGGETWSSWYNQPTAQFYHVSTDNQWPYWVYGGQQESGSAAVKSRGDHGAISFRDWLPVGAEEYGYIAPDPLNPDIIYGGKLTRFDRKTGQTQDVSPVIGRGRGGAYRFLRTAPVLFSPVDPRVLYYAGNVLFKTTTGGQQWDVISPDLSRETYDIPPSVGVYTAEAKPQATRRGVIYTIAPSPKDINLIWAGTDDGLIHVTRDGGKTWQNVTPPELTPWSKVSLMDAGHFDTLTAYAAVNRFRCSDLRPHIYRTHDGGKTWQRIVRGLPDDPINVVRGDPVRKGLLFAGSERAVYFSIDDGDNWLPLRQNMPATSIRDLVIKDGDLVVGTHGRSFWILDDMTPLRQLADARAQAGAFLFKPRDAYRVRRNLNTDTPLPPEEPVGENPPDGATIYFQLKSAPSSPVVLEIADAAGKVVRRYASDDPPEYSLAELEKTQVPPTYWNRPPRTLPATPGMHRWVWDIHYAPPKAMRFSLPISAIRGDTPMEPLGPAVMPGIYTARLTVDGKTQSQTFRVLMDPRVKTAAPALQQQHDLSLKLYALVAESHAARDARFNAEMVGLMELLQGADMPPTSQALAAIADLETRWQAAKAKR